MRNDQNLRQNLDYARSRRADRIELRQKEKVLKTLFFIHYDVPSRLKLVVFAVSFGLLWLSAAVRLFVRWAGSRSFVIVATVVSAVFLASLVVDAVGLARPPRGSSPRRRRSGAWGTPTRISRASRSRFTRAPSSGSSRSVRAGGTSSSRTATGHGFQTARRSSSFD